MSSVQVEARLEELAESIAEARLEISSVVPHTVSSALSAIVDSLEKCRATLAAINSRVDAEHPEGR